MSSVGGSPMAATLSTPPMRGVSCAAATAAMARMTTRRVTRAEARRSSPMSGPPLMACELRRVRAEIFQRHDLRLRRDRPHLLHPEIEIRGIAIDRAQILRWLGQRGLEVVPVRREHDTRVVQRLHQAR